MPEPWAGVRWKSPELVGQCNLYVGLVFADLNYICIALGVSLCFDANMISSRGARRPVVRVRPYFCTGI